LSTTKDQKRVTAMLVKDLKGEDVAGSFSLSPSTTAEMVQQKLSCYNCISYSTLEDNPRTLPLPWSHYYLNVALM